MSKKHQSSDGMQEGTRQKNKAGLKDAVEDVKVKGKVVPVLFFQLSTMP
jgi:hypothetical protein